MSSSNEKEVMGIKIPKGWKVVKLKDICKKLKAGGTPSTSRKEFWNGNIPFVKIEDISSAEKYLTKTLTTISEEGLKNSAAWVVPKNSLLFAMYGSLGEVAITKIEVATNQAILGIIPNKDIDVEFLYYWFLYFKPYWKKYAKPTTQANLTAEIVKNTKLPYPSEEERKTIVEILSTVDKAIQKVDEAIEKTERLKKGLMQRLLTKGIGHKEFKYSKELGCEIPKEWKVVRLKDICIINPEQIDPRIQMPNRIFLYIDISSVEEGRIKEHKEILGKNAPVRARRVIHKNDVIMSTVRPYLKAFALVPEQYDGQICSTGFAVLRCNQNKINSYYLLYTLLSDKTIDQCKAMMVGGQYPALNQSQVENLKIPLPPLKEQQKIAEILSTVDKKLELEKKRKEKFERIKKGLMEVLLSGKVGVRV